MTTRRRFPAALLILLAALLLAPLAAFGGEEPILQSYRKRFSKDAYLSEKESIVQALVTQGGIPARDALVWCGQQQRLFLEQAEKDAEKSFAKYKPAAQAFNEQYDEYADQQQKQGKPRPTEIPRWPSYDKFLAAKSDLESADRVVDEQRAGVDAVTAGIGKVIDALSPQDTEKVRGELAAGPLASKDWGARAEAYGLLATAKAPWVLALLQDAARKEEDPRALVAAIAALAGRDPVQVNPVFKARLQDVRWAVRAASIAAIERTPSKEGIDLLLERFPQEEGRLRDDCVRALIALTGADVPPTPEAWKQWWAINGAAWKGPPEKADPKKLDSKKEDAAVQAEKKKAQSQTGFFGIAVQSKRLVYVIDLSGSMNEKISAEPKDSTSDGSKKPLEMTRAEMAKQELTRAIRALEDGTLFSVVLYSDVVRLWRPEMARADAETRKAAQEFVNKAPVVGGTNTYDALEAALLMGDVGKGKARGPDGTGDAKVDTVILLSDGKPTQGRITDPARIRAEIKHINKTRGIAVHTIAFGKDADVEFMAGLATDNGGTAVKM